MKTDFVYIYMSIKNYSKALERHIKILAVTSEKGKMWEVKAAIYIIWTFNKTGFNNLNI